MKSSKAKRALTPALALVSLVMLGSTLAALWGGAGGFVWVLSHGFCGPLAVTLLHGGTFRMVDSVVALVILAALGVHVRYGSGWTLALASICLCAWPFLGWSAGV